MDPWRLCPEVGSLVRFAKHYEDDLELRSFFNPGDTLEVMPSNGDMGIIVRRTTDGLVDMVWAEEIRPY